MLFRRNVQCQHTPVIGHDAYGKAQLGKSRPLLCGVVKLDVSGQKTTVRVD
jgi:hypothetical protein